MSARPAAIALFVAFLALHLPFLPASLEDLDSINFALGVRQFDVAHHQPHPPGYPLYIAAAKIVRRFAASELHALSLIGVTAGALAVFPLVTLFRRIDADGCPRGFAFMTTLVTVTAPLYWLTAARPLSDMPGLAAALGVQALTLAATSTRAISAAAFLSGLAIGIRSQLAWLTVPLLALTIRRRRTPGLGALLAFIVGVAVWAMPLVVVSGGPRGYWRALFSQGAEDFTGVQMLWTTPTPRRLLAALNSAFVAPWATLAMASVMVLLAVIGLARLSRVARPALATIAVAFGPYLIFDLLFQESVTTRYALPLAAPIAYLAVRAVETAGGRPAIVVGLGLAAFNVSTSVSDLAAYAREPAPAFRLLADMRSPASSVVAMDRREALDLRRPIQWLGDRAPRFAMQPPSPPQHEWLELVKYWNGGGRDPVWFIADPLRADVDLVQHGPPAAYRWPLAHPILIGGVRPNEMDWYRLDRPDWYVGEGWALTPEASGVSDADRRGLSSGPIDAWVNVSVFGGGALVIGGRNFEPAIRPRLTITFGGSEVEALTVDSGFFLDVKPLSEMRVDHDHAHYARLTIRVSPPSRVAVEQFEAAPRGGRPVVGFGPGWHEQEYNPATGLRWRWLSERGELHAISWGGALTLHVEGESPRRYFSRPSRLMVRSGGQIVFDQMLSSDFSLDVPVPPESADGVERILTLETDQIYVPADRSRRTKDRRHLGLRIFKCELRPAPTPASP